MIKLRLATMDDAARLFVWRNDADTRLASHEAGPIRLEQHLVWLKEAIVSASKALYVAQDTARNGIWVGTGRLDKRPGQRVELSLTVDPQRRGEGYGGEIIDALVTEAEKLRDAWRWDTMVATVKESNSASLRAFWALNFRPATYDRMGNGETVVVFEQPLPPLFTPQQEEVPRERSRKRR